MDSVQTQLDAIFKKLSVEDAQVIKDVLADRELAEKKLKESEERAFIWLENSPACTKIIDLDFNLQYMSRSGVVGLGIEDVSAHYGKPYPFYFFPEDAKAKMRANLTKARETKLPVSKEGPVYDMKGNELWFQATIVPICDEVGEVEYLIVVSVEVTERKRAEQQLAEQKERLAVTLKSIGDGVITTDTEGRVVLMNSVAEALTGWTLNEAEGKPLNEVFKMVNTHSAAIVENPVDKVLESGETVGLANNTALISKQGTHYHIADSGAPIRDRENTIVGVVLVFRDITEEYLIREQLSQAQKMEAIGQLAGGIAHDFNNMLGGISGATELLGDMLPDDPDAKELHGMVLDSVRKAGSLTSKLLAFSCRRPTSIAVMDLHQAVQESLGLLEKSIDRKIRFISQLDAERSNVQGDSSQLQSAIMNLAINSTHAMPDGGSITLVSRDIDLDEAYCTNSLFDIQPGSFIELEVRDTGVGIAPQDLPRIFEPFFTTKERGKGTGLGLSTVFGTIQQHGGAVAAYSEVGKGTSFCIYLPLIGSEPEQLSVEAEPLHGVGNILLVDDEPILLKTVSTMLEHLGYHVETAVNGAEALKYYQQKPDQYDLVLLDMIMPVMSGKECFEEMKKLNAKVRVILSSGFTQEYDLHEMKEQGLCGFIRKPYSRNELSRLVSKTLHPKRAG